MKNKRLKTEGNEKYDEQGSFRFRSDSEQFEAKDINPSIKVLGQANSKLKKTSSQQYKTILDDLSKKLSIINKKEIN